MPVPPPPVTAPWCMSIRAVHLRLVGACVDINTVLVVGAVLHRHREGGGLSSIMMFGAVIVIAMAPPTCPTIILTKVVVFLVSCQIRATSCPEALGSQRICITSVVVVYTTSAVVVATASASMDFIASASCRTTAASLLAPSLFLSDPLGLVFFHQSELQLA